ncbi:hypothetical protein NW755_005226 [Fusarium falciforme]|uniref:Major facilitator superfamily (MFS) profile domain-containing protein n=1 Tax=Fusarium falciforme TaxID=195108 RepID=A0A9W8V410_9HYPO|nr:hypothetical protein NW755_005226 [Fusarium falciforme]
MEEFGANEIVATLGLSLFVLGYGLGPMLFSPMSETPQIGRSRIYFWTLFAFVLLELPTGYATNMAMLLVFRFLTGFLVVQFSQPEGRQSWTCTLQWRCRTVSASLARREF